MHTVLTVLLCFTFAAIILQIANGLDCYSCERSQCEKNQSTWGKIMNCSKDTTDIPVCLTMVYRDTKTATDYSVRKCGQAQLKNGNISWSCLPMNGAEAVQCIYCQTDWCNDKKIPEIVKPVNIPTGDVASDNGNASPNTTDSNNTNTLNTSRNNTNTNNTNTNNTNSSATAFGFHLFAFIGIFFELKVFYF